MDPMGSSPVHFFVVVGVSSNPRVLIPQELPVKVVGVREQVESRRPQNLDGLGSGNPPMIS